MTWSYNAAQLATSQLFQVRYLVGDTLTADQQVQDEEITFVLTISGSIYSAAAQVCRSLAAQLSRQADAVVGQQQISYSSRARMYNVKAAQYDGLASTLSAPGYAGGTSVIDKMNQQANVDRVQPQFVIGMMDNFLPVGPVGNETEDPTPGS